MMVTLITDQLKLQTLDDQRQTFFVHSSSSSQSTALNVQISSEITPKDQAVKLKKQVKPVSKIPGVVTADVRPVPLITNSVNVTPVKSANKEENNDIGSLVSYLRNFSPGGGGKSFQFELGDPPPKRHRRSVSIPGGVKSESRLHGHLWHDARRQSVSIASPGHEVKAVIKTSKESNLTADSSSAIPVNSTALIDHNQSAPVFQSSLFSVANVKSQGAAGVDVESSSSINKSFIFSGISTAMNQFSPSILPDVIKGSARSGVLAHCVSPLSTVSVRGVRKKWDLKRRREEDRPAINYSKMFETAYKSVNLSPQAAWSSDAETRPQISINEDVNPVFTFKSTSAAPRAFIFNRRSITSAGKADDRRRMQQTASSVYDNLPLDSSTMSDESLDSFLKAPPCSPFVPVSCSSSPRKDYMEGSAVDLDVFSSAEEGESDAGEICSLVHDRAEEGLCGSDVSDGNSVYSTDVDLDLDLIENN